MFDPHLVIMWYRTEAYCGGRQCRVSLRLRAQNNDVVYTAWHENDAVKRGFSFKIITPHLPAITIVPSKKP